MAEKLTSPPPVAPPRPTERLIAPARTAAPAVSERLISPARAALPAAPQRAITPTSATSFDSGPQKLSSPTAAPAGPPQQAKPPIPLPVVPPPKPKQEVPKASVPVKLPVNPPPQGSVTVPKASTPVVLPVPVKPSQDISYPGAKLSFPGINNRRIASIREISRTKWRDDLMPAHFDNCMFHVETGAREGGRRIVVHEFPKKDLPYSEDMGRSATTFNVRGYCIVYPRDLEADGIQLYQRDYRVARDILQERLDRGGAGTLQLPTYRPVRCVCQRYRMTEEQKLGGYVVFEMQFVELGAPPFRMVEDTEENMLEASWRLQQRVLALLSRPYTSSSQLPRAKSLTGGSGLNR